MVTTLNKILRGLMKDHLPADTLVDGHLTLPNGLRMCWGTKTGLKNRDEIPLPITFGSGAVAFMEPSYNTGATMDCSFSPYLVNGNALTFDTYDHTTRTASKSTTLSARYFVIGGAANK